MQISMCLVTRTCKVVLRNCHRISGTNKLASQPIDPSIVTLPESSLRCHLLRSLGQRQDRGLWLLPRRGLQQRRPQTCSYEAPQWWEGTVTFRTRSPQAMCFCLGEGLVPTGSPSSDIFPPETRLQRGGPAAERCE